ncbi:MAG TPA: hypothetical protein DC047_20370 [Blastocatellia bacterium]|nr:hypothetical protein [Blastocatellia bacterium]
MNTNNALKKVKRSLAIVAMLLTLVFVMEPILSIQPVVSAQTVTRRRVRVRRHRSFWQKHRDKLTVAGTTVAGAGIGGIVGGKKGALIGAGAGAGSGALYTYKLRRRHRRRY